jgi:hypothetical protein
MFSVAYLGNSVTAQRQSYVDFLHPILVSKWGADSKPLKAGLGGVGSLALAGLMDWLVIRHEPSVCFVECSLADAGGATPESRVAIGITSIVEDLLASGTRPIMLHLPRIDSRSPLHDRVASIYRAVQNRYALTEVNLRHLVDPRGFRDGVHTTPALSERIAREIALQLGPRMPDPSNHAPLDRHHRVRFVPATDGTCITGTMSSSSFRLALPTVLLGVGGSFRFLAPGAQFLGLYVIAKASSGVVRLTGKDFREDIQVWDEWCERPRLQFVPLQDDAGVQEFLMVEATDLASAEKNCQGFPTEAVHRGSGVEIVGAAVLSPTVPIA